MPSQLSTILENSQLADQLLSESQTRGFVTAMAAAPHLIDPTEWLAFMWGGEETSPFDNHEDLENYAKAIIAIWNEARAALFESTWQWPEGCALDDSQIVTEVTSNFCEGMLQGWQLARDDWETIMPPESEDNALLGGVLLSFSLLFDPETALEALKEQNADALAQFEEIFNAIPVMLCGLTQRGAQLVAAQ
ncbi:MULTISPECIES: UPF0149 family protein [Photobacterium]|uniref:UPF0149 family protein n=1 Tax=Photobacterium piscicola TaxID=1378299 RepID=A0A1T5HYM3_9GAMM|nr:MULTISPECIES: UPF0149 family protein [Photobacterium]MEC6881011.1 UPF0149 family protein [Photobacterium piscicola]MEC6897483.1 UPF0149 family protein [Photobacterium piscicola]MEC6906357.1 UPF0149 family protein [Photobacterium piscicola]PST94907.1 YecA family protein [Photobacterium sp. NCIMB 13483]SKC31971.1 hypothetical protein CZ809_01485 [Photobacterium piscicola]